MFFLFSHCLPIRTLFFSGKVVGVAEVSLPGGQRFGAEKLEPKAPGDFPYISDVAVAPNQGKRGIGRALVRAGEAAVAAQVSFYFRIGN